MATHNHFVLDRGGRVFKQTAPVIKLPLEATEDDHLALLGLLNSSTACFWMRQVCFPKGGDDVGQVGARVRRSLWDERYAFNATNLEQFPLPEAGLSNWPGTSTTSLGSWQSTLRGRSSPGGKRGLVSRRMQEQSLRQVLDDAYAVSVLIRGEMIAHARGSRLAVLPACMV